MLAKTIENKKQLMAALLTRDTFDAFETVSGSVTTYAVFSVNGQWHGNFYPDEETSHDFTPWSLLRPYFLSVIRGRNTPLAFQFVFRLPDGEMSALIEKEAISRELTADVSGLLLNLSFDGTSILLTTGVSHRTFSLDRTLERAWDNYAQQRFGEFFD